MYEICRSPVLIIRPPPKRGAQPYGVEEVPVWARASVLVAAVTLLAVAAGKASSSGISNTGSSLR